MPQHPDIDATRALHGAALGKSYRGGQAGRVEALGGFDLEIAPGESVALLGPNGSGKTTAIRLLLGLEPADTGTAALFGREPTDRRARARLGYLPEETELFPFLNADETLHLAGRLHGLGAPERKQRADELIEALGLTVARRRRVETYSKGMARRLAFGRAIVHRPPLLVLDEPTSGLDPEGAEVVFDMVERARADGAAVLFSTHILREATHRSARLVILMGGRIVCAGTRDELLGAEAPTVRVQGLGEADREALAAWAAERGGSTGVDSGRRRTLEELFRGLLEEHP